MAIPENIHEILSRDPGDEYFVEYAEQLKNGGSLYDAEQVCMAGLSAKPTAHGGRFILARIYFEQGYLPFAIRELKELARAMPQVESLAQLIRRFEPEVVPQAESAAQVSAQNETVAETEFDIGEIELIDDENS